MSASRLFPLVVDRDRSLAFPEAPTALPWPLVAAHENDLQSAKKHRLRTAFVHRPYEHGPKRASDIPPPGKYDFVANDFLHLADLMGV